MNNARKITAAATLIGALIGGGAMAANAATTTPSPSATSTATATADGASHGNETDLTGDIATKVKDAVMAANRGATVENMTTEGDSSSAYEAHITKTDGTHVTVKLDTNYAITATEAGGKGAHAHGNETDLTGDTATKVKDAVLAANAGATVENTTTEDDGSAAYEAHITKADGTRATVKLDANFTITATEAGGQSGHGH